VSIVNEVRKLDRNNVEPHKEQFIFCNHRDYFNLNTNSKSAHKGTNRGIKYNAVAVFPQHNLDKAPTVFTGNATIKQIDTQIIAA
jgi:hypothetical protein